MGAIHRAGPTDPAQGTFPLTRCHREFFANMRISASVVAVARVDSPMKPAVDAAMSQGAPGCG